MTAEEEAATGMEFRELDDLLAESDFVSVHSALTEENRHLLSAREFGLMKPGAFLINTARGPLVDAHALAAALDAGQLGGAGLDVLLTEPPPADNPLLARRDNCFVTPHIAWATRPARQRLMDIAVGNVRAFLQGEPRNLVSG